jgi:hypothetical protein
MKLKVDLVELIRQAAPQVWGSDERDRLFDWLSRNAGQEQEVTVNMDRIEPGPDAARLVLVDPRQPSDDEE